MRIDSNFTSALVHNSALFMAGSWNQSIRYFSKYISKSRTKRLPLTTKRAGKGYKKGYGARTEGFLTSKGISNFASHADSL